MWTAAHSGSLEILLVLLVAKLLYPHNVILLRGNHETTGTYKYDPDVTEEMVFSKELRLKYGQKEGMVGGWPPCCLAAAGVLLMDGMVEGASSAQTPLMHACMLFSMQLWYIVWYHTLQESLPHGWLS